VGEFVSGFFTRSSLKKPTVKSKDSGLSLDRIRELGVRAVDRMNPAAKTRHMQPSGSKRPDVYILGEAPGKNEDLDGEPFVGATGQRLRKCLPEGYRYRFDNAVRTLPPMRNGSPAPTRHEIEAYRNSVAQSIENAAPWVLLAVGGIAAGWFGEVIAKAGINAVRGRRFPCQIGAHRFWMIPCVHPSAIMRMERSDKYQEIPATEHQRYFERDVQTAIDAIQLPPPEIEPSDLQSTLKGILIEKRSVNVIQNFLAELRDRPVSYLDLETSCYRPYAPNAKILSIALGTYEKTIAFPLKHRQATWTKDEYTKLREVVGNFLAYRQPKCAHNTPFDLEWLIKEWGSPVAWEPFWGDTMGQQYCLDERQSTARKPGKEEGFGISLDFCCKLAFGMDLKGVENIDRNNLDGTDLDLVLRYNGRDTKYGDKLYHFQKKQLKDAGLWQPYLQWCKRIPAMAQAQVVGIPVSQEVNSQLRKKIADEVAVADKELRGMKAIRNFEAAHGPYVDSNKNNIILFKDMLGRIEGLQRGKQSYDDKALTAMADEPAAAQILKIRGMRKISGTYLDRLSKDDEKTFIFPDGRVHTSYKHCATDTKRIASEAPPVMNIPRDGELVKRQYVALPGRVCLFADYGGQEARAIAAMSQDANLVKFLRGGEDFHMAWTEKIVRLWPDTCKKRFGGLDAKAMKKFRQDVKSQWVFAGFFYARVSSRANYLEMPVRIAQRLDDEFWDKRDGFAGVKVWQRCLIAAYKENSYVESLGGHRRHGPMSESMVVNAGVQATGTDITADAWYRVGRLAYERKMPWLFAPLFVHDDISTFDVPEEKKDVSIQTMARIMCDVRLPGADVIPWIVEISEGRHWGEKKLVGEFRFWNGRLERQQTDKTWKAV
jgi:uracil-DNA glycosylase family 4